MFYKTILNLQRYCQIAWLWMVEFSHPPIFYHFLFSEHSHLWVDLPRGQASVQAVHAGRGDDESVVRHQPFPQLLSWLLPLTAHTGPRTGGKTYSEYRWTWIWRTTVRQIFAYDGRYAWSQSDAYQVFVICIRRILHMTDQFSVISKFTCICWLVQLLCDKARKSPFIHPFIHSFIHTFIHSFIHLFIYLFIHSFISEVHYSSFLTIFINAHASFNKYSVLGCHTRLTIVNGMDAEMSKATHGIPCTGLNWLMDIAMHKQTIFWGIMTSPTLSPSSDYNCWLR